MVLDEVVLVVVSSVVVDDYIIINECIGVEVKLL